jgi:hypothetical protein
MTGHLLVVGLDRWEQVRLDAGELVFPEHVESHSHGIVCQLGDKCEGWIECREPHEVDGKSAECGPYECDCPDGQASCLGDEPDEGARPRSPWYDEEEFEFHGVMHTWRYGHGWTVPFSGGCIVKFGDYELPDGYDKLPIGKYEVDTDWDDTNRYLKLVTEPAQIVDVGVR